MRKLRNGAAALLTGLIALVAFAGIDTVMSGRGNDTIFARARADSAVRPHTEDGSPGHVTPAGTDPLQGAAAFWAERATRSPIARQS
jgi:hypothetical protein